MTKVVSIMSNRVPDREKVNHVYVIETKIYGLKNYYSHWERLHPDSKVYGIVWNEFLGYAFFFYNKQKANAMKSRILQFDRKTVVKVRSFSIDFVKKEYEKLADLKKA